MSTFESTESESYFTSYSSSLTDKTILFCCCWAVRLLFYLASLMKKYMYQHREKIVLYLLIDGGCSETCLL